MDLLHEAYSNASDDGDDDDFDEESRNEIIYLSSQKNDKNFANRSLNRSSNLQSNPPLESFIPGRYISKRERETLGTFNRISEQGQPSSPPVLGNISDSQIPHDILMLMKSSRSKPSPNLCLLSEKLSVSLDGHIKPVNAIKWSTNRAHLLASAGMDGTVCIWNVWSRNQKKVRMLTSHTAAVKDVEWSHEGNTLLSCGYDRSLRLTDVETGIQKQIIHEDQVFNVVRFHPEISSLFLSGGSKGSLRLWDVRVGKVVREYNKGVDPILDVEFIAGADRFISSGDVSASNVTENAIIIWDVSRQVPLSNQVYAETYACPCVRRHPIEPFFVAQSNGNYAAIFSTKRPFRLDKYKRFEGHGVDGFPVKCSFDMGGRVLLSGSSDGFLYLYDWDSSELVEKAKTHSFACLDALFHPSLPGVVASSSWAGEIAVSFFDIDSSLQRFSRQRRRAYR